MIFMSTRLKKPQPRKNYILRDELFLKLDKINDYTVTLVKGCAGAGKTTLMTSFIKEKEIQNLKWISLDESCNNVFMFWNYFIEAAGEFLGTSKQEFISLYDSNFQKSNLEQLLTLLINCLDNKEELYFVLDDFYFITDGFLIETIDFFLKNMSDNLHLILLTRYDPLLYLGTLNMEGKLLVIEEKDLKLTYEAGAKFLTETLSLNLNAATIDFINNVSEGWIGGMQLVAAVASGKAEAEIMKINLGKGLVEEYFTKEIFQGLDDKEKEFLVITSMLSYFNEEICSKLLKEFDFKTILEGLLKKNILIICIDEENGIYRYHNILKEYLKGRFKALKRELQIHYHLMAAKALENLGDYDECIDQLLLGEDYILAMKLIIELPQNSALFYYVDRIPLEYITQNPDFAYQCFFYYYVNIEFGKCKELYDIFNNNMDQDETFSAFKFSNMFVEDTFRINEISVMSLVDIDRLALKDTTKAFILLKDSSFLYAQCRYDEALSFLDKAKNYSENQYNLYIDFLIFSIKSQILEDMGELNKCLDLYEAMDKILTSTKSLNMLTASFYIGITGVYLKQLELIKAEECLKKASEYISDIIISVDRGYRYNLAEYKFITGEREEALELVKVLITMESYSNLVYIAPLLKYAIKENNYSGDLVMRFKEDYEKIGEIYKSLDSKLLYANILYKEGEIAKALELTDQILKYSRMRKINLKLVQASLFKINILFQTNGGKREIINLFREALFYSKDNKILLPYYYEEDIVVKLIKKYDSDFYNELTVSEKSHYKEIVALCKAQIKFILSEREIDVVLEIAKGASNKEIGDTLCISLATVKSHIINIYSKLQVNNRVAAIDAAKKHGII